MESTSPTTLSVLPPKPPRISDESASSSSVDVNSPPPAKPPRHFSLYKEDSNQNLIEETNNVVKKVLNIVDTFNHDEQLDDDINVLKQSPVISQKVTRQISDSLKPIETFSVQPTSIAIKTDLPLVTKSFENDTSKLITSTTTAESSQEQIVDHNLEKSTYENIPIETNQLANELNIIEKHTEIKVYDNQKILLEKAEIIETPCDNTPSFPHSIITTHVLPTQVTKRPLVLVSSSPSSNPATTTKPILPLVDIITKKPTPTFTTSVTVKSSSTPTVSVVKTTTSTDNELDNKSKLISNSNQISNTISAKLLQTNIQQDITDANNDQQTFENTASLTQNTGSTTPARSFVSDYDNLHGSYGSLNDDNQSTPVLPSPLPSLPSSSETMSSTASSSMTTIYESFDNFPSISSSATSPTYVSAVSTFNTGGTTTPQYLGSDASDEEPAVSHHIENLNQGRIYRIQLISNTHESIYLACHLPIPLWFLFFHFLFLPPITLTCAILAWQKENYAYQLCVFY